LVSGLRAAGAAADARAGEQPCVVNRAQLEIGQMVQGCSLFNAAQHDIAQLPMPCWCSAAREFGGLLQACMLALLPMQPSWVSS
jgi:hypothetical protein